MDNMHGLNIKGHQYANIINSLQPGLSAHEHAALLVMAAADIVMSCAPADSEGSLELSLDLPISKKQVVAKLVVTPDATGIHDGLMKKLNRGQN